MIALGCHEPARPSHGHTPPVGWIAIGVLTRTFPPELVDRVIAKTGRGEQRQRLLPARVVVYYTLAMCLFAHVGYEEVMRLLVEGLAWMRRWQGAWQVPDKELAGALAGPLAWPGDAAAGRPGPVCGLELWRTLQATGAELVWRCRQDVTLPVLEVFADGSWRSELGQSQPASRRVAVRVIDYHLDDPGRPGQPEGYRLITTIADPERAPAAELPALSPAV